MIIGEVTPDKEAVVELHMRGPGGAEALVEAILDTGFTEYLALPSSLVTALALPYLYSMPLRLADGSPINVPVHDCIVVWDGQELIPAHLTGSEILMGMSLLYGNRLLLDAVDGGAVTITPLP